MVVLLLILILLAVLGVLGVALKIAAALVLGVLIAVTTITLVTYLYVRHRLRQLERQAQVAGRSGLGGTTVIRVGSPRRSDPRPLDPKVDDRY
jgi:hypothetical protein